jgi:hypothetical protein
MLPKTRVGGAVLMLAANPGSTVPSSDVNRTVRAVKHTTTKPESDHTLQGRTWGKQDMWSGMYRIWLHTVVPSLALNVSWGRPPRLPLNWAIKGDQVDGPSSRSKKSKANSVEKAVMFRVTQPPGFLMVQEMEDQEAGNRVTCTSPGLEVWMVGL